MLNRNDFCPADPQRINPKVLAYSNFSETKNFTNSFIVRKSLKKQNSYNGADFGNTTTFYFFFT